MNEWFLNKKIKVIGYILFTLFCAIVLTLSIRGLPGNPNTSELNRLTWKDNGPLELSPERGRYALTYAIAETHQFSFTPDLARFAAPDVGYLNGKYVSLFAPTVSFIILPGYLIGKALGFAQVGSFAVVALFALLNVFLIRAIAVKLGMHPLAGLLAGITFLFATPSFAYAVTLYQHHISTFIILLGIYLLIAYDSVWSLIGIWMLCALSISVDYPNFFMMLPIGIGALGRTFMAKKHERGITFNIPVIRVLAMASMIIPLAFFLWFNNASYGSPFQLSGTVDRSVQINKDGSPVLESAQVKARLKATGQPQILPQKSALGSFNSRLIMQGFYIHFLSPDRGMIVYTPVMLFGFAGMILALKRRMKYTWLLVAIIGFNVLTYSMWDDPYGGWAFGSRYLIPTYGVLSIFLAYLLTKFSKYNLFLLFFFTLYAYSTSVNTLGALTSNRNPPKVEAVALSQVTHHDEPYTYFRNLNVLNLNNSKSVVFEAVASNYVTAWSYYGYVTAFIIFVSSFLIITLRSVTKGVKDAL